MSTAHTIRIANDNGPEWKHAPRPILAAPVIPRDFLQAPTRSSRKPKRNGHTDWPSIFAGLYQLALFAAGVTALVWEQSLPLVGGLFALSALGGLCLSAQLYRRAQPHGIGRGAVDIMTGLALVVAALLLLPSIPAFASLSPLSICLVALAAAALLSRSRALAWLGFAALLLSLGGGGWILGSLTLVTSAALIVGAAILTRAKLLLAMLVGVAVFAVAQFGLNSGLHPARVLLVGGLIALTVMAIAVHARGQRGIFWTAAIALISVGLALQLGFGDSRPFESLWYASASPPWLTIGAVVLQGTVLGFSLLAWIKTRCSFAAVAALQLAAAALSYALIRPDAVSAGLANLSTTSDSVTALLILGGSTFGATGVGLLRAWSGDRPVQTGMLALAIILQGLILAPIILSLQTDASIAGVALMVSAALTYFAVRTPRTFLPANTAT